MSLTIWTNHGFRPEALELLRDGLDSRGYRLILSKDASAVVLAPGTQDRSLFEADIAYGQPDVKQLMECERIRFVELSSAGYTRYDRPDFRALMASRKVPVTNSSEVFADPCAQHVLAQMLALTRNLPAQLRNQDGPREWRYLEDRFTNGVLTGQKVLLLGFGAIGRRIAELLQPFRCRVMAFRRTPDGKEGVPVLGENDVQSALGEADHVINTLPESDATRGWMNPVRLAQTKAGCRYYNIGRGTTVDQPALIAALESGHLQAAYLDVMDPEPLPPSHPLWTVRNCFITCHIGGGTREQDNHLAQHFLSNLDRFAGNVRLVDQFV